MHQDDTAPKGRATDGLIQVIAVRLDNLHEDVSGMRDVLKELATAVTKLAIIEERQGQAAQSLERAFKVLENVEQRLAMLERSQPIQQQSTDWINRGMWAAVGVLGLFILKKVGLV